MPQNKKSRQHLRCSGCHNKIKKSKMKRSIIYSVFAALAFFACRKSDNPKIPDLMQVPTPLVTLDATSDKFINPGAPATFKGKFTVDLLFKNDIKPQAFDVVIRKNGTTTKVYKAGITSFPTSLEVTGQQLIDLFGQPIADGDKFDIGVDIITAN